MALAFLRALIALVIATLCTASPLVASYWPEYAANLLPPQDIPFDKLTHLFYFVSVPAQDGTISALDPTLAPAVMARADAARVPVILTVGGWTGSRYFSSLVASAASRKAFASNILATVGQHGMSGVQIDWEYPSSTNGVECNEVSNDDTSNLLLFLKELKSIMPRSQSLSLAVPTELYNNMNSATDFAEVLDFVMIMTYDLGGPWLSVTSPNAPLQDCAPSVVDDSVTKGIQTWFKGGMPAEKIVMGLPNYGYGYGGVTSLQTTVKSGFKTFAYQAFGQPDGGITSAGGPDICGVNQPNGGQWLFKELIEDGKLNQNGLVGAGSYERFWDTCSSTPFLYSKTDQLFIAYDDPESIAAKAAFAHKAGLLGVAFFDSTGDDGTILLDAARGQLIASHAPAPAPVPAPPKRKPLLEPLSHRGSSKVTSRKEVAHHAQSREHSRYIRHHKGH